MWENKYVALVILIIILVMLASFFINAGILWLICWAFHWTWWSWRICFGVWLLEALLSSVFKSNYNNK